MTRISRNLIKSSCLVTVLLGAAAIGRAGTILSVDPTSLTVSIGDTVTVTVDLSSDNPNISVYEFELTFPAALLQATTVTEEGFFAAHGCCFNPPPTPDNVNGVISGVLDSLTGGQTDTAANPGPDALVQFQFQAISSGIATVALQCDNSDADCTLSPMLSDSNFNAITPDTINSSTVTITPEPATTLLLVPAGAWLAARLRRKRTVRG